MTEPVVLSPVPQAVRQAPVRTTESVLSVLSSYLPLILMALLALGTWWLVKNTPLFEPGRPAAAARHEPDYSMNQFSVQRFYPSGALRARVEGVELRHYPDTDTLEIDDVHMRGIAANGRVTVSTARRAVANSDISQVQLIGGAHVVSEATATDPAIDFRGEFLDAYITTEQVRSHLPVIVTRGRDELRADGMDYDNLAQDLKLTGRTRVRLAASVAQAAATRPASAGVSSGSTSRRP
jgi:lipopolysaccharide export system protein LptC